jgi:signal peptidase II
MIRKVLWINALILTFFILDRIIKNLFLAQVLVYKNLGLLNFNLYQNRKIILGWSINNPWLNVLIFVIFIFLVYNLKKAYFQKKLTPLFALTLIIAGAMSNVLDKLFYGFIIDYINLGPWSIFNLADLMIWAGTTILIISYTKKDSSKTKLFQ